MTEEAKHAIADAHMARLGSLITNAAVVELFCAAWAQSLSTDGLAIAVLLGERIELPAVRKVIKTLARARKPELVPSGRNLAHGFQVM
jgi:hypothetical protein